MKNILILAVLLVSATFANAQVDRTREKAFSVPSGIGEGGSDSNAKWSLPKSAVRDETATAINPADGKILVRGVCSTSLTLAGGYVALYDSISISGATAAAGGAGTLVGAFFTKVFNGAAGDSMRPSCEWFPRGLPFLNGLVFINSAATLRTTVFYDKIAE